MRVEFTQGDVMFEMIRSMLKLDASLIENRMIEGFRVLITDGVMTGEV